MNYTEILDAIQEFTEYTEADFVSNIPVFVKLAEERITRAVELPLSTRTQQASFTDSNKFLNTPDDFIAPFSFAVFDADGQKHTLIMKQKDWIDEAYSQGETGLPKYYALHDQDSIVVGPTPDDAYLAELTYNAALESITTSVSGTNWISENAANALLFFSLKHAAVFMQATQDIRNAYEELGVESMGNLMDIADWRSERDRFRMRNIAKKEVRG